MDEQALILRLQTGERQALEEIIQGYTHYLTAVAARALGPSPSREDLEEVVSDAFLALWRSRDQVEPGRSLRPFLAVIVRNLAYSKLRSRRETEEIPSHLPDSRPGPEELCEQQALHRHLRQLVEEMEEPDRTLFLRYYFQEQPLHQVADALGLKESTAKTRLSRGRQRLKIALGGKGGSYVQSHS